MKANCPHIDKTKISKIYFYCHDCDEYIIDSKNKELKILKQKEDDNKLLDISVDLLFACQVVLKLRNNIKHANGKGEDCKKEELAIKMMLLEVELAVQKALK